MRGVAAVERVTLVLVLVAINLLDAGVGATGIYPPGAADRRAISPGIVGVV